MVVESQASRQITNARVLGKCSPTDHNPDPNSHPGLEEPWSGKRPARRTMSKGSSVTRGQTEEGGRGQAAGEWQRVQSSRDSFSHEQTRLEEASSHGK